MIQLPAKYDTLRRDLATYTKIDEVKALRDKAVAMEVYAFQVRDTALVDHAVELKCYATRRIGQLMDEMREAGEMAVGTKGQIRGKQPETGRGKRKGKGKPVTSSGASHAPPEVLPLEKLGIDKHLAKAARKAAKTPDDRFKIQTDKRRKRAISAVDSTQQTKRIQAATGKAEWHTPKEYLEAAREVMGEIDLDPASSGLAQRTVKAANFFNAEKNGLERQWFGRVFLNPPYNMPLVKQFVEKMVASYNAEEIKAGILLTNNATDTEWARLACENADAVCFTAGRIRFFEAIDGEKIEEKASPTCGQMFCYFGKNSDKFAKIFSAIGYVFVGSAYPCSKVKTNGKTP